MNRTRRDVILGASSVVVLTAALGDWRLGPGAPLSEPAEDLPATAADVPFIAPRYLDRAAVARQTVALPGLVQSILSPAFGAPARVDGQFRFPIILAEPAPSARFFLVSRDDLAEIDSDLYALPPLPGGETLMRERLRQAFTAEPGAAVGNILPLWEVEAERTLRRSPQWQSEAERQLRRTAEDSGDDVRAAVDRVRSKVAAYMGRPGHRAYPLQCAGWRRLGIGATSLGEAMAPSGLPPGLYALVKLSGRGGFEDVQLNAVYRPTPGSGEFAFVLAADLQWGDDPAVALASLKFVSLLNSLAASRSRPEFLVLAGDIVDCQFASAGRVRAKLFGGASDYPRDYLQAWLALANLRIPVFMVPGNHDGYRFEGVLGRTRADGLLLFENTFGPTYFSFDRPPYRFILINSYDLPGEHRTSRRSGRSNALELISDKLNTLNWGGGIRPSQHQWLRARLGLDGTDPPRLTPILISHHDPRGAYPALKEARGDGGWSRHRHLPLGARLQEAELLDLQPTPRSAETHEVHAGYFTPLRTAQSGIRSIEWFDLGLGGTLPPNAGFPGWSRYQQEWHVNAVYADDWREVRPLPSGAAHLVSPQEVLETLAEGRVGAIFKAHDNRFARASMAAGESILGAQAEAELRLLGAEPGPLERLRLEAPLSIFHVADVADLDSDGHGFFWCVGGAHSLKIYEIDHL